jgi:hypothetical protein
VVLALTAVTLVGALPYLLVGTHGFVAPHVALERELARRTSDFLLIDTEFTRAPTGDGQ